MYNVYCIVYTIYIHIIDNIYNVHWNDDVCRFFIVYNLGTLQVRVRTAQCAQNYT